MNLTLCLLEKGIIFFLLVSPAILLLFPRETQGEPGNSVGENEEDSQESEDFYSAALQAQYQDGFIQILEKLHSYEQFMSKMKGVPEKLDQLYAFLPLLQQLKEERLEQERLERERLEQERLERERLERERLERERRERERLKGEMMKSPRAKLYTGKNFTGSFETYDFNSASRGKGCHRLQSYAGQIKSIDTEGTCVRLFQWCDCTAWSQAFYPGIDGNAIDSKLEGVRCIGPCSPNELEDAEVKGSGSELTLKKGANGVPDLISDYWVLYSNGTSLSSSLTSIDRYNLGVGNRLEGVRADIYPKHLRSPEEAERVRNAGLSFSSARFQLDEDREEVGFAIPLELGGVSDQLYNIFPQDKAAAAKYRKMFVPLIKTFLQNRPSPNHYAHLSLRFFYQTWSATKPSGFWYWFHKVGSTEVMSGYIFN